MKTLVITDGLFNDYSLLNTLPFEDTDLYVFVTSKDRNKIDLYFKEAHQNVTIIKKITDLSNDFEKIWVFRIHEQSETPYELIGNKLSGEVKFSNAPMRPRFKNFREVTKKSTENLYAEMGLKNRAKKEKTKIKEKLKKMRTKAKSKTTTKPKKKNSKPTVRFSLKVEKPIEELLTIEAYD